MAAPLNIPNIRERTPSSGMFSFEYSKYVLMDFS